MEDKHVRRRLPSVLRWILWVLLVQFVLINISASLYAYRLTHFYNDTSLLTYHPTTNIIAKTWRLFTGLKQGKSIVDGAPDFPIDTITLHTSGGLTIDGWYSKSDSGSKGTVLLFHGLTVNKGTIVAEAAEFRYLGYNVMLVDFRAHGNSDGNTTTMGYWEPEEVKLAYDWVLKKGDRNIYLWGSSMGAVVVAKAMADYPIKPKGIILEMPFESLQTHLKARARVLGFPQQPFAFLVTFWIGLERGFNGYKHKTTTYVKNISCPVLLQWGELDNYVLAPETQDIFDAIGANDPVGAKQKKLVIYAGAGHSSMLKSDPLKWRAEVGEFINTCEKPVIP